MHFVLYGHEACSLCDRLEKLIAPHLASVGLTCEKRNIKENRDWLHAYRYRIPVLTCDGREVLEGNPAAEEVDRVMKELLPGDRGAWDMRREERAESREKQNRHPNAIPPLSSLLPPPPPPPEATPLPEVGLPGESPSTSRAVMRVEGNTVRHEQDRLAVEEPLEIRIGRAALAITMRTPGPAPGDDEDLAAGFCFTEGLFREPSELLRVEPCTDRDSGNVIIVTLSDAARMAHHEQIEAARRQVYISSSCGICGKQTLDRIQTQCPPIRGKFSVTSDTLAKLPGTMRAAQSAFDVTGGLHAAGLFDPSGRLIVLREDVGRHNAVDKVIGHMVRSGNVPIDPAILLVSGRCSFEIMQKAAMAGIAVVCSVSAPSSFAADFAARMNMTLVGFLRPGRMNVYHDAGRIADVI